MSKFLTPKGLLKWVFIDGEGKEDLSGNFKYQASLALKNNSPELKQMEKTINSFWEDNRPKGKTMKSNGLKEEFEFGDEGEKIPTGYTLVNCWTNTTFKDGKQNIIKVFDSEAIEVDLKSKNKKIGNGSLGFISGKMGIYNRAEGAGVSLYLNGIQITNLIEYVPTIILSKEEKDGWTGDDLCKSGSEVDLTVYNDSKDINY